MSSPNTSGPHTRIQQAPSTLTTVDRESTKGSSTMSQPNTPTTPTEPFIVEVWSDVGCPFCYMGKNRLAKAISQRPDADRFEVRFRSFELNPAAATQPEPMPVAFARAHPGVTTEQFMQMEGQAKQMAAADGLPYSLDRLSGNTFGIHRVAHYAAEKGVGAEFYSTVQDRFFEGTLNPFDADDLISVATELGLDSDEVRDVVTSERYSDEVTADIDQAREYGVRGVPFAVFGNQLAAQGAQSVEGYAAALAQAFPVSEAATR
ncbi:DsbA family oxidoreductase [Gordonia sp. N1V]|uniref:DsbA family oxidoreductase n=1 Tax=Gordonia sp. N1V TaxID=3034163 RepID=UPI0023E2B607|nr:DsbA family oxidoreductase [Gordonia sp. N1V]MDF3281037.1 DsbA family oxidoreductase [Gordonia sp. N1V]